MAYEKLQQLKADRAKLLAHLKTIQALPQPDLDKEAQLFELLEANTAAIYKTRTPEPDLPIVVTGDDFQRCDWLSIY